jgi:hypothetical protein
MRVLRAGPAPSASSQRYDNNQQARIEIGRHAGQNHAERFGAVPEYGAHGDGGDHELFHPAVRQQEETEAETDLHDGDHQVDRREVKCRLGDDKVEDCRNELIFPPVEARQDVPATVLRAAVTGPRQTD